MVTYNCARSSCKQETASPAYIYPASANENDRLLK